MRFAVGAWAYAGECFQPCRASKANLVIFCIVPRHVLHRRSNLSLVLVGIVLEFVADIAFDHFQGVFVSDGIKTAGSGTVVDYAVFPDEENVVYANAKVCGA